MTYKDLRTFDKIMIPSGIIVVTVFLLFIVITGYANESYNQGFYDGVNAFCEHEGVVIVNDKFVCYDEYIKTHVEVNNSFDYKIELGYTGQ